MSFLTHTLAFLAGAFCVAVMWRTFDGDWSAEDTLKLNKMESEQ